MHYKPNGKNILKAGFVLVAPFVAGQPLAASGNKPANIIFIMTDQQTADAMSNRGNPYLHTPGMDILAADGLTFTNAYCSYPLSGPSRASLFTGMMPAEINVRDNDDPIIAEEIPNSLGFMMSNAGYESLYAGKWHVPTINIPDGEFGFKKVCDMYDPDLVEHVKPELKKKRKKPLFLVASFLDPHQICEYARSQQLHYGPLIIPEDAVLPPLPDNFNAVDDLPEAIKLHKNQMIRLYPTRNYSSLDWQKYLYAYYRLVEQVDKHIYDLIMELKKHNLYDNSLIVFTSDHGEGVAAHQWNQKRALFEETINIPLIVKMPKGHKAVPAGSETTALTNIGTDIYATFLDFAQVPLPENRHGKSMRKVLMGEEDKLHDRIFIETLLDGVDIRAWAVIQGDMKYVCYRMFKDKEQLFDLKTDKGETKNLVNDPNYQEIRQELRQHMLSYAQRANDKMLIKEMSY